MSRNADKKQKKNGTIKVQSRMSRKVLIPVVCLVVVALLSSWIGHQNLTSMYRASMLEQSAATKEEINGLLDKLDQMSVTEDEKSRVQTIRTYYEGFTDAYQKVTDNISNVNDEVISIADDSKAMNDYASTMQERAEQLKQKAVNNQENTSQMIAGIIETLKSAIEESTSGNMSMS